MALYDFVCKWCTEGEENDFVTETVMRSMKETGDAPMCERCQNTMKRVYNQMVFGEYQKNKGIFPLPVHNLGNSPVTIESRDHLKKEMKARGRIEFDFSQGARDRHKDAVKNARRHFSLSPS